MWNHLAYERKAPYAVNTLALKLTVFAARQFLHIIYYDESIVTFRSPLATYVLTHLANFAWLKSDFAVCK